MLMVVGNGRNNHIDYLSRCPMAVVLAEIETAKTGQGMAGNDTWKSQWDVCEFVNLNIIKYINKCHSLSAYVVLVIACQCALASQWY